MSRYPMRIVLSALGALAIAAAACGGDADQVTDPPPTSAASESTAAPPTSTTATTAPPTTTVPEIPLNVVPASYEEYRNQPTACSANPPPSIEEKSFATPDDMGIDPETRPTATITTSCGDILVELDPDAAPETVNSFVFLASQGYFDGTVSHRIFPGFVIQAGDPTGTGRGGPGYVIADEFPPPDFVYERGVLAMANAGPGTTGSQFFIMLGDAPLPPQFSVFGRVTAGLDVLDRIADLPLTANPFGEVSVPLETLYLESVSVDGFAG